MIEALVQAQTGLNVQCNVLCEFDAGSSLMTLANNMESVRIQSWTSRSKWLVFRSKEQTADMGMKGLECLFTPGLLKSKWKT